LLVGEEHFYSLLPRKPRIDPQRHGDLFEPQIMGQGLLEAPQAVDIEVHVCLAQGMQATHCCSQPVDEGFETLTGCQGQRVELRDGTPMFLA
jgi:hypothetical protein